jgi:hypothetical protein
LLCSLLQSPAISSLLGPNIHSSFAKTSTVFFGKDYTWTFVTQKKCQNDHRINKVFREVRVFMISHILCFQVMSLVFMLALSALSVPVYEEHQQIKEHHYVSTQIHHHTTCHCTKTGVFKNCYPFVEYSNIIN